MVEKIGLENAKAEMKRRSLMRKEHPRGGSFKDAEFASRASKIGWEKRNAAKETSQETPSK